MPTSSPASSAASAPSGVLSFSQIRILVLASLGGALEFYDFVIFAFLAKLIALHFFPASQAAWLRQTEAFGLFGAGYLARPLGGIIMAHFGDIAGRKKVFTFSVLLMALPTLMMGLLPGYETLGPGAPLILLLLRMAQGAAIGGEAPGGWVFVAEHAPPGRVGLATGDWPAHRRIDGRHSAWLTCDSGAERGAGSECRQRLGLASSLHYRRDFRNWRDDPAALAGRDACVS